MKKNKNSFIYSIHFKIVSLLIILTVIPLIINVLIWHSTTSESAEAEAIENTSHLIRVSNDIFETALRDTFGIVSMLAVDHTSMVTEVLNDNFESDIDKYLKVRELESYILSISGGARSYYSGLSIIDPKGETYDFGVSPPYEAKYLEQYNETLKLQDTTRLITGPHHFKDEDYSGTFRYSDMVISIARPVFVADEYIGVISGNVWCNILLDIFDNALKDKTEIVILDRQIDEIIFSSDQANINKVYNSTFIKTTLSQTTQESGDFYLTINEIDYLCVYRNSDYTKWTTLGLIPRDQLLNRYNKASKQAFLITIIFSAISVIAGIIMTRIITRNIRKLNIAMTAVDENNLEIPVVINSKDEIGQLFDQYTEMVDRIKNLISNVKLEESNKRKYEVQALQSQINPHFLYNTLNTIKFLASMQGIENIQSLSESLSEILHTYMSASTILLPIRKELDLLNKYSIIQSYRFTNAHSLIISCDDALLDCMMPKLLLQPLVENSIVHGFSDKNGSGTIWLKISELDSDTISFVIEDNGSGFNQSRVQYLLDQIQSDEHIGIYNVNRRVKMYFGESYGLKAYMNDIGHSVFELNMPKFKEAQAHDYI